MTTTEEKSSSKEEQKQKIRERYKGINQDELIVIPAIPEVNIFSANRDLRTVAYCRVSTDDPNQTSSYELQKNHYEDFIKSHDHWIFSGIYADEGISGTSINHRVQFQQMIQDCKDGKIDLIITKSVSRFARNAADCLDCVHELQRLKSPVGVFFETENLNSLDKSGEMILTIMAAMAQEESHIKSDIMNASIEMRYKRGIFLKPVLLGYDKDEDGELVVNPSEALTVKLIFSMYLYGCTCTQIANTLTELKRQTKKGNTTWNSGSILQILQNERHCGDILAHKTYTPDYLNHKAKKNVNNRTQYVRNDDHEAIVSRADFIAVQHLIANAKYGNHGILPEIKVIPDGALKGFVSVHTKWAGFSSDDYIAACKSVYEDGEIIKESGEHEFEANEGDFDLRGFEIARTQFFGGNNKISVTFGTHLIQFSKEAVEKMDGCTYVELLIHPINKLLTVRPAKTESKFAIKWAKKLDGTITAMAVTGTSFLKVFYELMGWKKDCKYRICGIRKQNESESVLVFDLTETEVFILKERMKSSEPELLGNMAEAKLKEPEPMVSTVKRFCAYPVGWANGFGSNYYFHSQSRELQSFAKNGKWDTDMEGQNYGESPVQVPDQITLIESINNILDSIKQEGVSDNGRSDNESVPDDEYADESGECSEYISTDE